MHGSTSMNYEDFIATLLERMEERWTDYLTGVPMDSRLADEWYFLSLRSQAYRQIHGQYVPDPVQVVRWAAFGKATVASDKVYAIYGLLHDEGTISLAAPNYNLDADTVYWNTSVAVMKASGKLLLLQDVHGVPRNTGIPSWVPDFNRSPTGFNAIAVTSVGYGASGDSVAEFTFTDGDTRIATKAQLLGSIAGTIDSEGLATTFSQVTTDDERIASIFNVVRCYRLWIQAADALTSYPTGEEPIDALLNVMFLGYSRQAFEESLLAELVDLIRGVEEAVLELAAYTSHKQAKAQLRSTATKIFVQGSHNVPEFDLKALLSWPADLDEISDRQDQQEEHEGLEQFESIESENFSELDESLFQALLKSWDMCSGSASFWTQDGYLGTAPAARHIGDVVALISGLDFPMILRRRTDNYFTVVGPAYIWGLMDGERWDRSSLKEIMLE
jgi:hypothetical protein